MWTAKSGGSRLPVSHQKLETRVLRGLVGRSVGRLEEISTPAGCEPGYAFQGSVAASRCRRRVVVKAGHALGRAGLVSTPAGCEAGYTLRG